MQEKKRTLIDQLNFGHGLSIDCYHISHVGYSDPEKLSRKISSFYYQGKLIDATFGDETQSLIVLTNGYAVRTNYSYERLIELMDEIKNYCPNYERM